MPPPYLIVYISDLWIVSFRDNTFWDCGHPQQNLNSQENVHVLTTPPHHGPKLYRASFTMLRGIIRLWASSARLTSSDWRHSRPCKHTHHSNRSHNRHYWTQHYKTMQWHTPTFPSHTLHICTIFKSCTIPMVCPSTSNKKRPLNDVALNTGSGSFQFQKKPTPLLYIQWLSSFYDSDCLNEEQIDQVQALLHQQYPNTDGLHAVCVPGSPVSTSHTNCWSIRADFKCCRQSLGHCHEHYHHHPIL